MAYNKLPKLPTWAEDVTLRPLDLTQPTAPQIKNGFVRTPTPPKRPWFNWFFNRIMSGLQYLTRRGIADWDANEEYLVGDKAVSPVDGKVYQVKSTTLGNEPSVSPLLWEQWGFTAEQSDTRNDTRYSKLNGNDLEQFAVATATAATHAVRKEQLDTLSDEVQELLENRFQSLLAVSVTGGNVHDFTLAPLKSIRVFLLGGGGEGGRQSPGDYEVVATHGNDSFLSTQNESIKFVIAQGGRRGQGGWYKYLGGARGADGVPMISKDDWKAVKLTLVSREVSPSSVPATAGLGGYGSPAIANHNGGGYGGTGAFVDATFTNLSGVPLSLRVRAAAPVPAGAGDNQGGFGGYCVLYIEPN